MKIAESSSPLCLACGLCCTGTLHEYVEVQPQELQLVGSLGVTIETFRNQSVGFRQPCVLYRSECCSAYAHRPVACQKYRCVLLRKLDRGEMTLENALAIVNETKGLIAEIDDQEEGTSLRRRLLESWDAQLGLVGTGAARQAHATFALRAVTLDVVLQKHFRGPGEHEAPPDPR
jgi:Fe-S-cluster containining protein